MKVISLSNQKGGVGKTTTCAALAAGLSHKGYKVLGVDLDPQCNFCIAAGIDPLQVETSLYEVFKKEAKMMDVIVPSPIGYDFAPGKLKFAGADMEFTQTGREYMLRKALETVSDRYDYVIIDTPPTLGILVINALTASQGVIVPMGEDLYSLQGLSQLSEMIESTREYCNRDLEILGLLVTKRHERQTIGKILLDKMEEAADQLQTKVFKAKIRESVAIREAVLLQADFLTEAPKANASIDYNEFIEEVISDGK